jgi:hypothetical protein
VTLTVTADEPIEGATFEFQRPIATIDGGGTVLEDGHRIVLPALTAQETLAIVIRYASAR